MLFQVHKTHVLYFISICDLFSDSPSMSLHISLFQLIASFTMHIITSHHIQSYFPIFPIFFFTKARYFHRLQIKIIIIIISS
jgi:hypothetical protein